MNSLWTYPCKQVCGNSTAVVVVGGIMDAIFLRPLLRVLLKIRFLVGVRDKLVVNKQKMESLYLIAYFKLIVLVSCTYADALT